MKINSVNIVEAGKHGVLVTYHTDCGRFETVYRNNRLLWAFGSLDYMDLLPRELYAQAHNDVKTESVKITWTHQYITMKLCTQYGCADIHYSRENGERLSANGSYEAISIAPPNCLVEILL
ncbi:hypothetical protein [Conchiformibius steedae]|uniref:Uncharacterized protein n=1 Tax=Conchiformibius steedae TaxID=153493 RepID=A0A3P2A6D6_9NEIS|nr:hypothetical protein [Conchiformibius steedae]RRD90436.1 hypothetical protein EII21_05830 [Conchiformibius steedae]